ncbi:uncharacterized protein LOC123933384 isoform X2 [Meles meles]|uniref:uncharacterized protein LOC123933384 isoform X2 n=1 Tax=Meles meles TaxID=9662 RepID=UPI001E698BB5|nr:uncharacterized protein LOC123933384 isoform X2 [Meles meles]
MARVRASSPWITRGVYQRVGEQQNYEKGVKTALNMESEFQALCHKRPSVSLAWHLWILLPWPCGRSTSEPPDPWPLDDDALFHLPYFLLKVDTEEEGVSGPWEDASLHGAVKSPERGFIYGAANYVLGLETARVEMRPNQADEVQPCLAQVLLQDRLEASRKHLYY